MTIFDNDHEVEQVQLHKLETKEEMHAMMIEKGFFRKGREKLVAEAREQKLEEDIERMEKTTNVKNFMIKMYGFSFVVISFIVFCMCRIGRSRSSKLPR
mmetsp:Transcript_7602/g.10975  ORF Transcript_7602/g.10975 Transcript_7602/m.10975 type:complete len:99 (+) Transcript_7602:254-550(+)